MTCDYIPHSKQLNDCNWNYFGFIRILNALEALSFSYSIFRGTISFQTNRCHETSSQQGHFIDFIAFFFSVLSPRAKYFISPRLLSCL